LENSNKNLNEKEKKEYKYIKKKYKIIMKKIKKILKKLRKIYIKPINNFEKIMNLKNNFYKIHLKDFNFNNHILFLNSFQFNNPILKQLNLFLFNSKNYYEFDHFSFINYFKNCESNYCDHFFDLNDRLSNLFGLNWNDPFSLFVEYLSYFILYNDISFLFLFNSFIHLKFILFKNKE
jgi:hypothetical protein